MQNTEIIGEESTVRSKGVSWRRLPGVALLAAVAAAVANALVFFAASGLGFIPENVLIPTSSGESSLTVGMVVGVSAFGAVGATVAFAVIGAFAQRPVRLFRRVAMVMLVLSFVTPLTIPGAPVAMVLSLEAMHVVAWAVISGLLTTLARRIELA